MGTLHTPVSARSRELDMVAGRDAQGPRHLICRRRAGVLRGDIETEQCPRAQRSTARTNNQFHSLLTLGLGRSPIGVLRDNYEGWG